VDFILAGHGHGDTITGEGEEASPKQLTRKTMEGAVAFGRALQLRSAEVGC